MDSLLQRFASIPRLLLAVATLGLGCDRRESAIAPAVEPAHLAAKAPAQNEPAAAVAPAAATPRRVEHHGITWYVDDADAALDEAKRSGKLVFVDLWAPWCHTCLSMREYVLTATHLADVKDRLVFLALDTERPGNAPQLLRWAVSTWPTLYLVDGDAKVQGRWVGAASPAQLSRFVRDGLRAFEDTRAGSLAERDPLALLIAGDRQSAAGAPAAASTLYRQALRAAPSDWPRRPETWVALAGAHRKLDQPAACAELGIDVLIKSERQLSQTASATDFIYLVLDCARGLDPRDARGKALSQAAERKLSLLCEQGGPAMTPDDRGDACGLLRERREALGDLKGAKRAAEQRLRVLEAAAQGVPDAVALTYDWARSETLLALSRGDEAVAFLQARERALPDDYNAPYYLARTYRALDRHGEALVALERAIARAYGPRRVGMLTLKADLLLEQGEKLAAKQTLEQQLAEYRALPLGQRQSSKELAVEKRLTEL